MQRVEEMGQASEVRAAVSGSWSRAAHTGLACAGAAGAAVLGGRDAPDSH